MTNRPLISIIIPTFNRAHIISETLESIINQTYLNWECIIVDDGSTDSTLELIRTFCRKDDRFKYYQRPSSRPKGANACRNYGFSVSKGKYIQWFDSDDIMLPNKLEIQLQIHLEKDLDFVICEGDEMPLTYTNSRKKWGLHLDGNVLLNHIRGSIAFGTNGPLFKSMFLKDKPLFDETLIIRQEWEFFNRLLMDQPNIGVVNESLYLYRSVPTSIRGTMTSLKLKSKMHSDRKILKLLNKRKLFNAQEDFIYRRDLLMKHIKYVQTMRQLGQYKGFWYGIYTLVLGLNYNYLKTGFKKVLKKPYIIKNIWSLFLFKK